MTTNLDTSGMWGGRGRGEGRLSLLELVRNYTLDVNTAALLWLLVEKKSSVIVASMPQLAGKTTLLTALLDFAPPWYQRVLTRGRDEDFSFLGETDPASAYVLVPELSNHTSSYLWDDKVRTLFDALDEGYSMAATMHADAPGEVLYILEGPPVYIPRELLHHVNLIVNLRLLYGERDMVRRVSMVTMVTSGPSLVSLGQWDPHGDTFNHSTNPEARAALAERAGMTETQLDDDLKRRAETLSAWLERGRLDANEVRRLIAEHYQLQQ